MEIFFKAKIRATEVISPCNSKKFLQYCILSKSLICDTFVQFLYSGFPDVTDQFMKSDFVGFNC